MKLLRSGEASPPRLGALREGRVAPLGALSGSCPNMRSIVAGGPSALRSAADAAAAASDALDPDTLSPSAPIERPGEYLAIGMNYQERPEEAPRIGGSAPRRQLRFDEQTTRPTAAGTPEGVAVGMDPPVFLKPGDLVRCEIGGVGVMENKVAALV